MDPAEKQFPSVISICQKLFYYIMKTLTAQAHKPITLGHPYPSSNKINKPAPNNPPPGSCIFTDGVPTRPVQQTDGSESSSVSITDSSESDDNNGEWFRVLEINDEFCSTLNIADGNELVIGGSGSEKELRRVASDIAVMSGRKGPPKKTVSIKDEVEVIDFTKKKRKSMNAGKHMSRNEEERKPLKSILKVGSGVSEKATAARRSRSFSWG